MLSDFIAGHSSLQSALPVLFDAAIKGAILVIIAAVATYLLRGRSAASRHAVWTAAVIGHPPSPLWCSYCPRGQCRCFRRRHGWLLLDRPQQRRFQVQARPKLTRRRQLPRTIRSTHPKWRREIGPPRQRRSLPRRQPSLTRALGCRRFRSSPQCGSSVRCSFFSDLQSALGALDSSRERELESRTAFGFPSLSVSPTGSESRARSSFFAGRDSLSPSRGDRVSRGSTSPGCRHLVGRETQIRSGARDGAREAL